MTDLANLQTALAKVRKRFLGTLPARGASISRLLNEVERGCVSTDCIDDARMALHKTAGTAEPLGYHELGRAAAAGEVEIAYLCQNSGRPDDLSDRLRSVLDLIASALRQEIS